MDKKFYPSYDTHWDSRLFRCSLEKEIRPYMSVLDFGAGRGSGPAMNFRGTVARISGVDVDDSVLDNPLLDEARVLHRTSGAIPYEDSSFDIVYSCNVLEHLQEPEFVFKEISRVLKPGGLFLSKTPNRLGYVATAGRLMPTSFHVSYNKLRGRDEIDTFPTVYRCNTPKKVKELAQQTGFEEVKFDLVEGRPEYLRINPFLYLVGLLFERVVNSSSVFQRFRNVMMFTLRKPS